MNTPRIAYCSPVNPAPTGISDYSEELLPYLGQYADVTLFVEDGLTPSNADLNRHLAVLPLRRLVREQRRRPFDAILYHMGNSPAHGGIWTMAQRLPGVVVLHEVVLHHFMLWYAANVQHDIQRYVGDMANRYGESGAHIAQLMIRSRFTDAAFNFPCCEPVVQAARGLIAHSRYAVERVQALHPDLPTAVVPMGVPLPPLIPRAEARARLGLPPEALLLASFGHINGYKRMEPALRALAELRRTRPDAHYLLVGSVSANFDLNGLVERMGLADAVTTTGYVPRAAFEDYVAAADICLNLRHPTAGETSASLLRLLGAGKPTLVSATGSFAELPPGVAAQVDVDASEGELILAYCRLLMEQPEVAEALGRQARAFVAAEHTLDQAAQGTMRFLAKLHGWPVVQRVRPAPLWEAENADWRPETEDRRAKRGEGRGERGDVEADNRGVLIASVAQSLVELGITERDEALLHTVAQRLAEVGVTSDE
ncbi:MAG: glycosyltransferase family 4 protein [Chloroflexaceae bacterium]|jgi:glycosyltransferase involved in cell wall biosynthesis|nr:glycosyltransferase family 4 protein [Chloroflexaceae bacterium]